METDFRTQDLLEEIMEAATSGVAIPFIHRRLVKEEDILALVDELKTALPADLQVSRQIIDDREKIINAAKSKGKKAEKEAEERAAETIDMANNQAKMTIDQANSEAANTVQMARTEATRLVSESNVVRESNIEAKKIQEAAKQNAEQILAETKNTCDAYAKQAQSWSEEIRRAAFDYAAGILKQCHELFKSSSVDFANKAKEVEQFMDKLDVDYDRQNSNKISG